MQTKQFDDKVRDLVFNPHFIPSSQGYRPGDTLFNTFGDNLLAKNTFKIYSLLSHINNVMDDPAESIGWLCKQLDIECDIAECDIDHIDNVYDNVHGYLLSDIDEETGAFWLFDDQAQATRFLESCKNIIKYQDILMIGNAFQFDIIHNAELFADTVLGGPSFYLLGDEKDLEEPFDEYVSKYFRAVYAGIVYYWAAEKELLTHKLHIKNENKDNYKN